VLKINFCLIFFQIKGIAGNIIQAISSSNTIVGAGMVIEAIKARTFTFIQKKIFFTKKQVEIKLFLPKIRLHVFTDSH